MLKLEIVHNRLLLKQITQLRNNNIHLGFTTMRVHQGFGPHQGEYKDNFLEEDQFYSILLLDSKESAKKMLDDLRLKNGDRKIFYMTSEVQCDLD